MNNIFYPIFSALKIAAFSGALALTGISAATAQTKDHDTANLDVSIQIKGGCQLNMGDNSDINFGKVMLNQNAAVYEGTLYIQCTSARPVTLELDEGENSAGSANSRRLRLEGFTGDCANNTCIPYNVYQGAKGNRAVWGTGTDVYKISATEFDSGDGDPAPFWIEVPATSASLQAGVYSDKLTITLNY